MRLNFMIGFLPFLHRSQQTRHRALRLARFVGQPLIAFCRNENVVELCLRQFPHALLGEPDRIRRTRGQHARQRQRFVEHDSARGTSVLTMPSW